MPNIRIIYPILSLMLLWSLLSSCSSAATEITSYTVYLNHVYKINPQATRNGIIVRLVWSDPSTVLDAYFYSSYWNVANDIKMQYFGYVRTSSSVDTYININGVDNTINYYYLRVIFVSQGQDIVRYNLTISTTSPYSLNNYTGWFSSMYQITQQFIVPLPKTTLAFQSYSFSMNSTADQDVSTVVSNKKYATSFSVESNQSFCIPLDASNTYSWVVAIAGGLNERTDAQVYKLILYNGNDAACSACSTLSDWDYTSLKCDNIFLLSSSGSKIGIIIGASVGAGVFLIILVMLAIILCRRCKFQTASVEMILARPSMDTQQHLYVEDEKKDNYYCNSNLIDENVQCPICLQGKCEVILPCNHPLHRHCIDAWLQRDNKCPVCRYSIEKRQGGG